MVESVEEFVAKVNAALQTSHEHERLKGIIERIENYAVFDSLNEEVDKVLATYNQLDLLAPMPGCPGVPRHFVRTDGPLKVSSTIRGTPNG
jgi:hypothetical protein